MEDYGITIEHLLKLCSYGTHINIKLHDTGKIVINGVDSLSRCKNKKQKAKWEAFRIAHVDYIKPTCEISNIRDDLITLNITANIYRYEYESAIERMEKILEKGENEE